MFEWGSCQLKTSAKFPPDGEEVLSEIQGVFSIAGKTTVPPTAKEGLPYSDSYIEDKLASGDIFMFKTENCINKRC